MPTDIRSHVILTDSFSFLITVDFGRIDLGPSQSERRFLMGIILLTLPLFLKHSLILKVFDAFFIQAPFAELLLVLVESRKRSVHTFMSGLGRMSYVALNPCCSSMIFIVSLSSLDS